MRGQHRIAAAIDKPEYVIVRDLLTKTNAARTENAAFIIERNTGPDLDIFRFLNFVF